ncbi:adenylate/guanylate cyclase domain-containing protein [Bradyrhizobium sp. JYMT SZCCT0180]|uniref:adenylate/guanylate cyclase domain-containing protein n=1 Tax=Bradyrhizobium sp. JYMT SZCCT0180 TaxID=2807666 RepID=UPI001BAB9DF0|nr:adenylate/guanylate cyclase domain-containing protein [Bradyrhizobium sp. JYMT SZCCT0180]MBR1209813.1 adenylate/guanylate cyclase domain-containing protein [Bradyrhizobium sp. JYMT SZCCT0180]
MSAIADVVDITDPGNEPAKRGDAQQDTLRFAEAALTDSKREGLLLAVRARWVALAVTAATLPIINPEWEVLYYVAMLGLFALIGWAQLKVGKAERSVPELVLIFCDLMLMTFLTVVPNPWSTSDWPLAMQYRFDSFIYFFVFLGTATLAYSWRTVVAMGFWTSALWAIGVGWVYLQPQTHAALSERVRAAVGADVRLFDIIDPSSIGFGARFQQITVFLIVAMTLALAARRSNALLISHAGIERERTNLARYFSPNVVEQLSKNDDPLKQVRTQNVAVLFTDIVDFTAYADGRSPMEVIGTLRQFHERMEREVFRHAGTLDKYLGDGLMATFGTPFTSDSDAGNALRCAQAMIGSIAELNRERNTRNEPPIKLSVGLHYGQVVLGDIGLNRLEFAVIGTAVNAASRLEALTREYGCALVASDELVQRARAETGSSSDDFLHLVKKPARTIRGLEQPVGIWTRDYDAS